jgi:hypothetical protein
MDNDILDDNYKKLMAYFCIIKRFILGLFYRAPKTILTWSVKDFNRAKMWAKTQPHPHSTYMTLWDYFYNEGDDSVWVLSKVNRHLGY